MIELKVGDNVRFRTRKFGERLLFGDGPYPVKDGTPGKIAEINQGQNIAVQTIPETSGFVRCVLTDIEKV